MLRIVRTTSIKEGKPKINDEDTKRYSAKNMNERTETSRLVRLKLYIG